MYSHAVSANPAVQAKVAVVCVTLLTTSAVGFGHVGKVVKGADAPDQGF